MKSNYSIQSTILISDVQATNNPSNFSRTVDGECGLLLRGKQWRVVIDVNYRYTNNCRAFDACI